MMRLTLTRGCPNGCEYCPESKVVPTFAELPNPDVFKGDIQILDMNLLYHPRAMEFLRLLPKGRYELVCGVDWRRLTQEVCDLMHSKGFVKPRWAWDYWFSQQKIHAKVWQMFKKAGYKSEELSVFMLVNWEISYDECCRKLDLLKVWNVKVNDCCWDGGYKRAKPQAWTIDHLKDFRKKCRKHNQLVNFKIDPEENLGAQQRRLDSW